MDYPSFYKERKPSIEYFLHWLTSEATDFDLVRLLGIRYRQNFGHSCIGMDWKFSLKHLQLIALCLGGRGLAAILRTLSIDHKHFSGGLPDLLVVRAIKWNRDSESGYEGENGSKSYLNLEEFLNGSMADLYVRPEGGNIDSDLNCLEATVSPSKVQKYNDSHDVHTSFGVEVMRQNVSNVAEAKVEMENDIAKDAESNVPRHDKDDKFTTKVIEDLALPFLGEGCHLSFECLLVEVKGPTDRLSYRQQVWLQVLQESEVNAWVCRVSEVSMIGAQSDLVDGSRLEQSIAEEYDVTEG